MGWHEKAGEWGCQMALALPPLPPELLGKGGQVWVDLGGAASGRSGLCCELGVVSRARWCRPGVAGEGSETLALALEVPNGLAMMRQLYRPLPDPRPLEQNSVRKRGLQLGVARGRPELTLHSPGWSTVMRQCGTQARPLQWMCTSLLPSCTSCCS